MSCHSLMIRASAGSGKTYQLANRFLALLALGAEPSSIIALTFTRKAAGEFADRILARLVEGAATDQGAARLAADLGNVLSGDPGQNQPALVSQDTVIPVLDQTRFRELLEKVVSSLNQLALGTIDAFFTRIARTSWAELGLSGFALLEAADLEAEKEQAFSRIFSRVGGREDDQQAFLQAFKLATFGVDENRFVERLDGFIDVHHERYLACSDEAAWGGEDRLWPTGCPWPECNSSAFKQLTEKLALLTADKSWEHKTWGNSWGKLMEFFREYEPGRPDLKIPLWDKLSGVLPELRAGSAEIEYSRKLISLRGDAAVLTAGLLGAVVVGEIRARLVQTHGIHRVIKLYEQWYAKEVRARGRLGFKDLTMVLARAGIGRHGTGQNIGYRLDQWFEHWMLDEFQDTSRLQWEVLSGLIQEVQQDDEGRRSFFVVGDPKQGVHAWRGGEPRLFGEIAAEWQGRLPEWSMDRSHRSSARVLDLVNVVCDPAGPGMCGRFPDAAMERWQFSPHQAARQLPGESLVIEVPEIEVGETGGYGGEESEDEANEAVASKPSWPAMVALLEKYQPLARGRSCAILVQTNKTARAIGDYIRFRLPDLPVEVESETPMEDDGPLAAALLDYFRWLHTPADRMAWGHVAHCPLFPALVRAFETDSEPALWQSARAVFHRSGMTGLLERVGLALRAVFPIDPFSAGRLEAWELEARQFDARGGDLKDWLRFLSEWKTREYSGAGAIQIMTVHKSKGLEFDMVILPDLDGTVFDNEGKLSMLTERDALGHTRFLTVRPPGMIVETDERLRELRDQWVADQCYEKFCGFYVAMTRAVHGLYLLVPELQTDKKGEQKNPKNNHAGWLRAALAGHPEPERRMELPGVAVRLLWNSGDDVWLEEYPFRASVPEDTVATVPVLLPAPPRLRARTPSGEKSDEGRQANNAARDRRGAMEFGSAVHAAFETIGWLDANERPPAHPDPEVEMARVRCLAAPSVRAIFTRPPGQVDLWREQPFDVVDGDSWTSGIMDRVHIHWENGRAVRAVVIDYKTDTVETVEVLVEKYQGQMQSYRASLARILGIEPSSIQCIVISTHLAQTIEIP